MPIIPNSQRTREELRAMGRKGGIASGKARRRRRILREYAREVSEVFFLDLFEFSRILGVNNPAALEWLIIEMISGLREEQKRNMITMESLLAMGFSPDRARSILAEYREQSEARADPGEDPEGGAPEACKNPEDKI